jgi:hypothetical protein
MCVRLCVSVYCCDGRINSSEKEKMNYEDMRSLFHALLVARVCVPLRLSADGVTVPPRHSQMPPRLFVLIPHRVISCDFEEFS